MPPVSPTSHSAKNNEQSLYQIEWISPMPPFNCCFSLQESSLYLFSPHSTDSLPLSGTGCLASGKPSCLLGDHPSYRRAGSRLLPLRMVPGRKVLNHGLSPGQSNSFQAPCSLSSDKCLQELALVYHALYTFYCLMFPTCLFSSLCWQNKRL